MLYIFSRYRQMTLLAAVVFLQVLLLAYQIKRDHNVRLIRYWAADVVTPPGRAGTWSLGKVGDIWSGYIGLHGAHTENLQLRADLGALQLRNRELETRAAEADRLSAMLNFREAHTESPMVAAQVIEASADDTSHTIFINRGQRDQVRPNMAVITPDGIVGKVVEVFPSTAQVLLLTDKESGVGALFGDTRTHGVLEGNGDPLPRMDYVVNDEKVTPGEQIITSGEDRIFPKGLAIGTVLDASPATPFQAIRVKTAARLDRLEDVLVLLSVQQLTPKQTDGITALPPAPAPAPVNASATAPGASATAPASQQDASQGTSPAGPQK